MRTAYGVTIGLAAAYLALALYGKYRKIKDDYRQAVEDDLRARQQHDGPPIDS